MLKIFNFIVSQDNIRLIQFTTANSCENIKKTTSFPRAQPQKTGPLRVFDELRRKARKFLHFCPPNAYGNALKLCLLNLSTPYREAHGGVSIAPIAPPPRSASGNLPSKRHPVKALVKVVCVLCRGTLLWVVMGRHGL